MTVSELITIQLRLQSTLQWKVNRIDLLTNRWPFFLVDKVRDMKVQVGNCVKLTLCWQQLRRLKHRACKGYLTKEPQLNYLSFKACCSPWIRLKFDVWQVAVHHFFSKLFTVAYVKCVLLKCSAGMTVKTQ